MSTTARRVSLAQQAVLEEGERTTYAHDIEIDPITELPVLAKHLRPSTYTQAFVNWCITKLYAALVDYDGDTEITAERRLTWETQLRKCERAMEAGQKIAARRDAEAGRSDEGDAGVKPMEIDRKHFRIGDDCPSFKRGANTDIEDLTEFFEAYELHLSSLAYSKKDMARILPGRMTINMGTWIQTLQVGDWEELKKEVFKAYLSSSHRLLKVIELISMKKQGISESVLEFSLRFNRLLTTTGEAENFIIRVVYFVKLPKAVREGLNRKGVEVEKVTLVELQKAAHDIDAQDRMSHAVTNNLLSHPNPDNGKAKTDKTKALAGTKFQNDYKIPIPLPKAVAAAASGPTAKQACKHCGAGHSSDKCWQRYPELAPKWWKSQGEDQKAKVAVGPGGGGPKPSFAMVAAKAVTVAKALSVAQAADTLVMDSGDTDHCTYKLNMLHDYEPYPEPKAITIGDGGSIEIHGEGTMEIETEEGVLKLNPVLYVPRIAFTLVSLGTIHRKGYGVHFPEDLDHVHVTKHGRTIWEGRRVDGLYHMQGVVCRPTEPQVVVDPETRQCMADIAKVLVARHRTTESDGTRGQDAVALAGERQGSRRPTKAQQQKQQEQLRVTHIREQELQEAEAEQQRIEREIQAALEARPTIPSQPETRHLAKGSMREWHLRLGHSDPRSIKRAVKQKAVRGVILTSQSSPACLDCIVARLTRQAHTGSWTIQSAPGEQWHADYVSMPMPSFGAATGLSVWYDPSVSYRYVVPVPDKKWVIQSYEQLLTEYSYLDIKHLHLDNGGEYEPVAQRARLQHRRVTYSPAYEPELNAYVERSHLSMLNIIVVSLYKAHAPAGLWAEAALYAVTILNALPCGGRPASPWEYIHRAVPNVARVYPFGCCIVCLIQDEPRDKVSPRGRLTIYLNTDLHQQSVRVMDIVTCRVYQTTNFRALPHIFPLQVPTIRRTLRSQSPPAHVATALATVGEGEGNQGVTDGTTHTHTTTTQTHTHPTATGHGIGGANTSMNMSATADEGVRGVGHGGHNNSSSMSATADGGVRGVGHGYMDLPHTDEDFGGVDARITAWSPHFRPQVVALASAVERLEEHQPDPQSWEECKGSDLASKWRESYQKEIDVLKQHDVFTIVPRNTADKGDKVIPVKEVFKFKYLPDGTVERLKTRLCPRGDLVYCADQVYAGVSSIASFRLLILLAAIFHLVPKFIDIKGAFLYGSQPERVTVYVSKRDKSNKRLVRLFGTIPPGFAELEGIDAGEYLLYITGNWYGIPTAPRLFGKHLHAHLTDCGWMEVAERLYLKRVDGKVRLLAFHVDDGCLVSRAWEEDLESIRTMYEASAREDTLLGHMVIKTQNGFWLGMPGKLKELVAMEGIQDSQKKRIPAPEAANNLPAVDTATHVVDEEVKTRLQAGVGSLLFIARMFRPDISAAVNILSKRMKLGCRSDLAILQHVYGYLANTWNYGLLIEPAITPADMHDLALQLYTDANYGGDRQTRKSVSGILLKIGGVPVIWGSKQQTQVATSTAVAELLSLHEGLKQTLVIVQTLREAGVGLRGVYAHEDNRAVLEWVAGEQFAALSKNADIPLKRVQELVEAGAVTMVEVSTELQEADGLTKLLPWSKFRVFRDQLGIVPMPEERLRNARPQDTADPKLRGSVEGGGS